MNGSGDFAVVWQGEAEDLTQESVFGKYFLGTPPDGDGDGVSDSADACPGTPAGEPVDPSDGCSISQICRCQGPRDSAERRRSHGRCVRCVSRASRSFAAQGRIRRDGRIELIRVASRFSCGSTSREVLRSLLPKARQPSSPGLRPDPDERREVSAGQEHRPLPHPGHPQHA